MMVVPERLCFLRRKEIPVVPKIVAASRRKKSQTHSHIPKTLFCMVYRDSLGIRPHTLPSFANGAACPCPSARDFVNQFEIHKSTGQTMFEIPSIADKYASATMPDTRQSSRGWTEGRTDKRTDTARCRVACARLKVVSASTLFDTITLEIDNVTN